MRFYWRECVTGDHLAQATLALMDVVARAPGCETNPYLAADNEDQFRRRLVRATRGRLIPVEHVKAIRSVPAIDMFEIRWSHIAVVRRDLVSGLVAGSGTLHVRLLYLETGERWVVGLLAHEKSTDGSAEEVRDRQNDHIRRAEAHAAGRAAARWGVPELAERGSEGLV